MDIVYYLELLVQWNLSITVTFEPQFLGFNR